MDIAVFNNTESNDDEEKENSISNDSSNSLLLVEGFSRNIDKSVSHVEIHEKVSTNLSYWVKFGHLQRSSE